MYRLSVFMNSSDLPRNESLWLNRSSLEEKNKKKTCGRFMGASEVKERSGGKKRNLIIKFFPLCRYYTGKMLTRLCQIFKMLYKNVNDY
jgi:hypothetical protein